MSQQEKIQLDQIFSHNLRWVDLHTLQLSGLSYDYVFLESVASENAFDHLRLLTRLETTVKRHMDKLTRLVNLRILDTRSSPQHLFWAYSAGEQLVHEVSLPRDIREAQFGSFVVPSSLTPFSKLSKLEKLTFGSVTDSKGPAGVVRLLRSRSASALLHVLTNSFTAFGCISALGIAKPHLVATSGTATARPFA